MRLWIGAIGTDAYDHLIFATDLDGLKAMRKILRVYYFKHHLSNISAIANRWSHGTKSTPDVQACRSYILGIAQKVGEKTNTRLWLENPRMMAKLCKAIVYAENGENPYPEDLYKQVFGY